MTLVPSAPLHDAEDRSVDGLSARLAGLDKALSERAAEIARAQSDLEAFRIRYRQEVGLLHDELDESSLWQLKAMVDEAAAKGRDLMGEMVARLKRDIMRARHRLDAMQ